MTISGLSLKVFTIAHIPDFSNYCHFEGHLIHEEQKLNLFVEPANHTFEIRGGGPKTEIN